jgi:hypothetical protein
MAITDWPEGERPRDNTPRSGLLRRRLTFNVKLGQRVLVPFARLRDNQRHGCGILQLSRMASCFIQRAGVRETGTAGFIIKGCIPAIHVRLCRSQKLSGMVQA